MSNTPESDTEYPENEIVFLSLDDVISLHEASIKRYSPGESLHLRDPRLLESAVMAPQQTWGGEYLYPTLAAMAAQYLFGINQNHAFENGNKRVAFSACSTFLRLNGYQLTLTQQEAVDLTLNVAKHKISKESVIDAIEDAIIPTP